MSQYLSERIKNCADIELHFNTEITEIKGDEHLEAITITNNKTKEKKELKVGTIFSFIGAMPHTELAAPGN